MTFLTVFAVSQAFYIALGLQVGPICEQVRQEGDAAVRQLTEKFDKVKLDDICIPVQVCAWLAAGSGCLL